MLKWIACLLIGATAQANKLSDHSSGVPSNLIEESNTLKIQNESTIQDLKKESERVYGLKIGKVQGKEMRLALKKNGQEEEFLYDLSEDITELGARFGYYPFQGRVDLGLETQVSYFSVENTNRLSDGSNATKLHVAGIEGYLSLKHRLSFAPWLIPQLAIGGGVKGVFQRGYDDENTSVSEGFGVGLAALNFDLSRWKFSALDWGLFIDAKSYFGGNTELGLTKLTSYSLGLNISL